MNLFDKLRRQKFVSFSLILFTLAVGVVIGTLINTAVKAKDDNAAPGAQPLTIPSPAQLSTQFSQIAKMVEPSVVNIQTSYTPKQRAPQARRRGSPQQQPDDGGMDDFFYRFFGNPFGGGPMPEMPDRRGSALGSGVVVDRSGYILTNNHVVEGADRIQVKFPGDPTQYDAKVIGTDPPTDLAVIRVTGKSNLTPARIGNSDAVQVGDWAVAIGSPFGFQATVTAGIISAKEREVPGDTSQFQHFLQTDAAINPGNSGGPLLDIKGNVIGINTAIASRSGGYQGIGFALPINTAVKVYNQIIKTGRVTRGSIGVSFRPSDAPGTADLLKAYGATEGVFVQEVAPGGPSEKAGLKAGDIIVAINGQPVRNGNELIERVTNTAVGSTLQITVLRENKRQNFTVTVADLSKVFPDRFGTGEEQQPGGAEEGAQAKFGITIQNLTAAQRQNMGLKTGGVLVTDVMAASFGEDVGLVNGDVIVEINRQPVNSVDDVRRIQGTLRPGDAVAFRVMRQLRRGGEWTSTFLAGTLPANR
ncbi:MAG: Do family serine endopeptidase [Bryobacteraceae bacterium]